MTQIAEPQERRHTRSHSQLSNYLQCSWSFRLKRIKRVQERPSTWLVGGKAFHAVSEVFDRATWQEDDLTGWVADRDQWVNAFDDQLEMFVQEQLDETGVPVEDWRSAGRKTKDKPNGEDLAWWRTAGRDFTLKYIDWRAASNDTLRIASVEGNPAIELQVDMPLGGVPVIGYIDRVFRDPTSGVLEIVDMKSGSRTPDSDLQLGQYSVQAERLFHGEQISWGAYYDARKGVLGEPIDLTRYTPDNLGQMYRNLDRAVEQSLFIPNQSSMCKACSVRDACIFQGGIEPA